MLNGALAGEKNGLKTFKNLKSVACICIHPLTDAREEHHLVSITFLSLAGSLIAFRFKL